jgi:ubiquinone/menaquinone biosynthesis C-methylase UbiE
MGLLSRLSTHVGSGRTTRGYYSSMNRALFRLNEEYTMLHYPYFESEGDSFLEAQTNLTDYCISQLPSFKGKALLEIGCGNGVQAMHIQEKYSPGHFQAIDLNEENIDIARTEARKRGIHGIAFHVDDAHLLSTVEDNSMDLVISIESAFHYTDKTSFLQQIHRVLKPGGTFLIADILTRKTGTSRITQRWKKKMSFHHWPLETYQDELGNARLHGVTVTDITPRVIRGFRLYKNWLKDLKSREFLDDLLMKLYYTIHARLNVHLLKTSRQYCVFVGNK